MAKTPAQLVQERLALAAKAQAEGNAQAAANYAQAAANIKGSGQSKVQEVANQYAAQVQPQDTGGGQFLNLPILPGPKRDMPGVGTTVNQYDRSPARTMLMDIFRQYGMEDLASAIDSFIVDNGANDSYSLTERVRSSNQYKDRFKGLIDLRAKGITDVANEGDYLRLESSYRQKFRDAGLSAFLGQGGTSAERSAIADLVSKYSVSVDEVGDRIADAQRVIADTPQEVRDSLQRYYNVDPTTLVSYVLDPTRTSAQVNRLANAAIIGGYGTKAGLDITATGAQAAADLAQGQDLNIEALQTDLAAARSIRDETKRLAEIEKTDLTDTEAFQAQLKTDAGAAEKVKTLQSRERARFTGSSGIGKGALTRRNVF